ncbi:MAG: HAD-IA family hydrolase [Clostridia bacterium]|nr:HAD-IA family hydrolase [Clostridia bacterium]
MSELLLFDLDGTLLDTLDDLHAAVCYALKRQGLPTRTRAQVRDYIGNGIVMLMKRAVGEDALPAVDMAQVMADFKEYYGAHCQDKTAPYDGILELLAALKAQGKKIAVVSNKADFAVKKLCEGYFSGLVDVAIGENEAGGVKKKPAPDTVFAAVNALGGALENAVYIGDSEVDIQTARNAGIACISVSWGMKDREFLLKNGAKIIVDAPEKLLGIL